LGRPSPIATRRLSFSILQLCSEYGKGSGGGEPQLHLIAPDIHYDDFGLVAQQHRVADLPSEDEHGQFFSAVFG
jgi:hypothetical protein